jgi:hypothetical protein
MRGKVAKLIRKIAKEQANDLPVVEYFDTVEKEGVRMNPITRKLEPFKSITTRIEPRTQRAVVKLLKKIFKEAKQGEK